jgi:hypothetical protein
MNIGITVGLNKEYESLWINGIKLNILNLAKVLLQIDNYNVYILDTSSSLDDLTKVSWDYNKYKTYKFNEKKYEMDVIFMVGTALTKPILNDIKLKNPNAKIVKYHCGNNYIIDMERVIFNRADENAAPSWEDGHDETWYVPQQEYHNKEYYEVIYRQDSDKVKVVPFIWDSEQLDIMVETLKEEKKKLPYYIPNLDSSTKRITIMEPNMNVVKYSLIPILIADKVLRDDGRNSFNKVTVGSGNVILKNNYFKRMLLYLDLVKQEPKIKFVPRYPVTSFLSLETDIVVSHQWGNPLNYAYLDALYFGFPLVHNSYFLKDVGYYYPDFKINDGAKMLKKALYEHDNNIDVYNLKSNYTLQRYKATNQYLIETYRMLVENLFVPNKYVLSYEYDPNTNLYK